MIQIRKSDDRGRSSIDWLDARHSFSFADYRDPDHMGFRTLRVLNEDRVEPAQGFGMHPHRDMEIVTYILSGALQHRDSMGNGSVIRPGDVQYMCAGRGVMHSEHNPSEDEQTHLLQIWILPDAKGLEPGWRERHFSEEQRRNRLCVIVSNDGREDSLRIHQDAVLYATLLDAGQTVIHEPADDRHVWLQVARGEVAVNGTTLAAGDGAAIGDETTLEITATSNAECLLFDLA